MLDQLTYHLTAVGDFFAFDLERAARPDMWIRYCLQVLLLCGSAFFSGSETALFSLSHVDLRQLRRQRHRHAETLHALLDEPRRLIVSILCGNELVNVAAVANMTGIVVALYGEAKAGWVSVLVMLPLLLLLGEVTPKTIAVTNPRRISGNIVARPMSVWVVVVAPLRWVIRVVSERITTWIVGPQRAAEHILQVDEFRSLVEDVAEAGRLNATGRLLINNLLSAGSTEIVRIMTPRSRIAFLDAELGVAGLIEQFKLLRHSRVPVYRQNPDNLVGFIHAEDVVAMVLGTVDPRLLSLDEFLRPPVVVPLTKKIDEMFDFFQDRGSCAAAVLNEFGGVAGFITVTDVLRFIFGDLMGQTTEEMLLERPEPDVYELPGDTKLTDLNRLTDLGLSDPRMTTIAGVVFRHLDRLPQVGDEVTLDDLTITVTEMEAHRIARVRIRQGVMEQGAAESHPVESGAKTADETSSRTRVQDPGSPGNAAERRDEDTKS